MAALGLAGCDRGAIDPFQSEVVRSYARGLVSTLEAQSLDGISPFATPREVGRMRLYVVMLLEERQVRVQAQLLNQEILSTETLSDTTARVTASEQWSLTYLDRETGKLSSRDDYEGVATYTLVKSDGRWYVDGVSTE